MTDEPLDHASSQLPIVTATDGHAYLGVDAVVALLRAIAESCRTLADDPDASLEAAAAAIDMEADNLDCRGIEHTHPGRTP
jgi:ABC-type nitrate/sulfonate/bicarbonate transport system substrate-binding protein